MCEFRGSSPLRIHHACCSPSLYRFRTEAIFIIRIGVICGPLQEGHRSSFQGAPTPVWPCQAESAVQCSVSIGRRGFKVGRPMRPLEDQILNRGRFSLCAPVSSPAVVVSTENQEGDGNSGCEPRKNDLEATEYFDGVHKSSAVFKAIRLPC